MLHCFKKSIFKSSVSIESTPDKNSSDLTDLKTNSLLDVYLWIKDLKLLVITLHNSFPSG